MQQNAHRIQTDDYKRELTDLKYTWVRTHRNTLIRQRELEEKWKSISIGGWAIPDLIGLFIAVILIYTVGRLIGSFIGRGIYSRFEMMLKRVPIFKQVYPYVKQITDFMVGSDKEKVKFNKVIAVQYPRKGIWSIGLLTGDTMRLIQDAAGVECATVFIPSSPTPFTGYVITVPVTDIIDLPITIDEALRFVISGGLIVPDSQVIDRTGAAAIGAESPSTTGRDAPPRIE